MSWERGLGAAWHSPWGYTQRKVEAELRRRSALDYLIRLASGDGPDRTTAAAAPNGWLDSAAAARIRARIGQSGDPLTDEDDRILAGGDAMPPSAAQWLLEQDDQAARDCAFAMRWLPEAMRRDIMLGRLFGSQRPDGRLRRPFRAKTPSRPVPAHPSLHYRAFGTDRAEGSFDDDGTVDSRGVIEELRSAGLAHSMFRCRTAADAVGVRDWPALGAADLAEPLPGYARWALCVHPGCPDPLRQQFGGADPRYRKRMRRAGIVVDGPAEYAAHFRPAEPVLAVLGLGLRRFPDRSAAAGALIQPLVQRELGANPEAWAVLAHLLSDFRGGAAELIRTAGAVAGSA